MSLNTQLSLLFARLAWPSGLARERACVAIAHLLLDPGSSEATKSYLIKYLQSQPLENLAGTGLLPLLYARERDSAATEATEAYVGELVSAVGKRSILSWLLVREIDEALAGKVEDWLVCSGSVPYDFAPSPFFEKHATAFLPPAYDDWARLIDELLGIPFKKQWAYEWALLVEKIGAKPSVEPLRFWVEAKPGGERFHAVDMELSDVYSSALLRAFAWATSIGAMPPETAIGLSARTCPIDLDLWQLQPGRRPTWWPVVKETNGPIEIAPAEILSQIEDLWRRQSSGNSTWLGRDWVLAEASGQAHLSNIVYDLEICGVFQKCHGPDAPNLDEIADWYREDDGTNEVKARCPSPLRLRGGVLYAELSDSIQRFGDWTIAPASGFTESYGTNPRWQYWRMYRKLWLPAPYISKYPIMFQSNENEMSVYDLERTIGSWRDWTDGIGETMTAPLPPATGQYLVLKRDLVEQFAADTGSTFCWVCRLVAFHRERSDGE